MHELRDIYRVCSVRNSSRSTRAVGGTLCAHEEHQWLLLTVPVGGSKSTLAINDARRTLLCGNRDSRTWRSGDCEEMKALSMMRLTWILGLAAFVCIQGSRGTFMLHGGNVRSGRLWAEHKQVYYPICSSQKWRFNEAQFVCRSLQLGAPSLQAVLLSNSYTVANVTFFPSRSGDRFSTEKFLSLQCGPRPTCDSPKYDVTEDCGSGKQVVLSCFDHHVPSRYQAQLQATTGLVSYSVEMWYNGRYFPVCANSWSPNETRVACRELQSSSPVQTGPTRRIRNASYVTSFVEGLACTGSERWLSECYHSGRGWVEHACPAKDVASFPCPAHEPRGVDDDRGSSSTDTPEPPENSGVPSRTFYVSVGSALFVIILLSITTTIGCYYRSKYMDLKRTGQFSLSALERMNNASDERGEKGNSPSHTTEAQRQSAGEFQSSLGPSAAPRKEEQTSKAAPAAPGSRQLAGSGSARSSTPATPTVRRAPPPPPIATPQYSAEYSVPVATSQHSAEYSVPVATSQHAAEYSVPVATVHMHATTPGDDQHAHCRRTVGVRYVNAAAAAGRSTLPPVDGACNSDYVIDHVHAVSFASDPDYLSMHYGHTGIGTRV